MEGGLVTPEPAQGKRDRRAVVDVRRLLLAALVMIEVGWIVAVAWLVSAVVRAF